MEPALAIFAPLIGHCFAATIAPDTVDTHCFADVYAGSHVRDTHTVTSKGKAVYEGESIYSFNGQRIEFVYVNSMGGVGHGTALPSATAIDFSMTMKAMPSDEAKPYTSRWVVAAEAYSVSNDGKPAIRFARTK